MIALKKIISPIIYFAAFPMGFISSFIGAILMSETLRVGFKMPYNDPLIYIIEAGFPFLVGIGALIASAVVLVLLQKFERLTKPTIKDHIRQCVLFYFSALIFIIVIIIATPTYFGALQYAWLVILFGFNLFAIIMNAVYLIIIRKYYLKNKLIINHKL